MVYRNVVINRKKIKMTKIKTKKNRIILCPNQSGGVKPLMLRFAKFLYINRKGLKKKMRNKYEK